MGNKKVFISRFLSLVFILSLFSNYIPVLATEKLSVYLLENFEGYSKPNSAPSGFELLGSKRKDVKPINDNDELGKSLGLKIDYLDGDNNEVGIAKRYGEGIKGDFVVDLKVKVENLNGSVFFEIKDSSEKGLTLAQIDGQGNLRVAGKNVKLDVQKWYNIAFAVTFNEGGKTVSLYINGEKKLENLVISDNNNLIDASYIRVRQKVVKEYMQLLIDDFRIYQGLELKTLEELYGSNTQDSLMDFSNNLNISVEDRLQGSVAMVVGNENALINNNKVTIDSEAIIKPEIINNETLVPVEFVVKAFNGTVNKENDIIKIIANGQSTEIVGDIATINGEDIKITKSKNVKEDILLPLDLVGKIVGKKVYKDYRGRGLIVIGDNESPFDDSKDVMDENIQPNENEKFKIEEAIKEIVYERPTGDKVMNDLLIKKDVHPRLIATRDDFDRIKDLINAGDPFMTKWYGDIEKEGEKQLQLPLPTSDLPDGRRMISSRQIGPLVMNLSFLYRLSDDEVKKEAYKERIWQEVSTVASFDNWNEENEFLNTAEFIEGFALAYDWMYEFWTQEQRDVMVNAMVEKGLVKALQAYKNNVWWSRTYPRTNNWNAVCNGAIGMGILAIGDLDIDIKLSKTETVSMKEFGGKIIETGFNALEDFIMLEFTPDGAWAEGPGYWKYTLEYIVKYISALETAVGTSYGHDKTPGFNKTAYFPTYLTGAVGSLNYGDAESNKIKSSEVLWAGSKFNDSILTTLHLNNKLKNNFNGTELEMLWYNPENYLGAAEINLDEYFRGTEVATFRSRWDDANAGFLGLKSGNNVVSHGHYDLGSFVYEALGEQWAIDLGKDDYNMQGYFNYDKERLTYYRLNPEGHNTLVVNPDGGAQQNIKAFAKIDDYVSKDRGGYAITDLTEAYSKDANSVKRGVMLTDNRTRTTIQDEISLKEEGDIWWFMHTKADIEIMEDGKSAILTKGGKKIWAGLDSNVDARFKVMDAKPLDVSPNPANQNQNVGIRKLAIELQNVKDCTITVNMVPVIDEEVDINPEIKNLPLNDWSIPDGELVTPALEKLNIDGVEFTEFNKEKLTYDFKLPLWREDVPVITAEASDEYTIDIQSPEELPGITKIVVASKEDKRLRSVYYLNFKIYPENEEDIKQKEIKIQGVTASASQDDKGNTEDKAIDGDENTYWGAEGDQWIKFDLGKVEYVNAVDISFIKGNERTFKYDIETSIDGENWRKAFSGESIGETRDLERTYIKRQKARYIRIFGHGNSVNQWNSYGEVKVYRILASKARN